MAQVLEGQSGLGSIIQTVPSLALLAIMVPVLAAMGLQSIGYLPALIGLFFYSLLPILRNTVTGLQSVDPALIEAARGVGMTPWQRWQVHRSVMERPPLSECQETWSTAVQ